MASGPRRSVTGVPRLTVRTAGESDLAAALALVEGGSAKLPWHERIPEMLDEAVLALSDEYRACIAQVDRECAGFGVYGSVAGCIGTEAIYAVVVADSSREAEIGGAIVTFIAQEGRSRGSRLLVAQVPGYSELGGYGSLLESGGLVEESRVSDYYRDGVPLIEYRLELG